jgi:IS5 family transposase
MADLLDESIREKYRQYFINDPLEFMRKAVDWSAFPPLLKELYHNDMDKGGAPNIPVTTMVKVLFLQSIYSISDEQIEKEIHDRISFMNFLDYPDRLPDSTTIWMFRERLSTTGRDRVIWNELQRQIDSKGIKIRKGTMQDATFITSDPGHERHQETRELGKTRRSKDGTFTKKNSKTYFGYRGYIVTGDNSVPFIKSYAVTTASVHYSKVDPQKRKELRIKNLHCGISKRRLKRVKRLKFIRRQG